MNRRLCALLLIALPACSSGPRVPEGDSAASGSSAATQAAMDKFEDIIDVMDLMDETLDPLFHGTWPADLMARKKLAHSAQMLTHGFAMLQTSIRPKNVEADFDGFAQDTGAFMKKLAAAADQDNAAVKALFADPRSVGKQYCGRCHQKYRDD